MNIYDTLSRSQREFVPRNPERVLMFVCGPTVYDYSHIGHARTYLAFDMIARYLRHLGHKLTYLQNVTDIDDKVIARAEQTGSSPKALAEQFEQEYHDDMAALGVTSVDRHCRATDYVPAILSQIQRLIERGYAYATPDGNVYFEVDRFAEYGKLSGRSTEEVQLHRIEPDPAKRKPYDFSLWKAYKPGEPHWESPWGRGRPGWHIEDTAITETEFGPQYDLHGGGLDLRFPHHEAEIAQMEAASGMVPFVNYWLHTGFLQVSSQKMSKSLGNFLTIREGLKLAGPHVWRTLFFQTHYRSPIDFTQEKLEQSRASWERIRLALQNADRILGAAPCDEALAAGHPLLKATQESVVRFHTAMVDDFGTPDALAGVFDLVTEMNRAGAEVSHRRDPAAVAAVCTARRTIGELLSILGYADPGAGDGGSSELTGQLMELLIELRQRARSEKRFADADMIRDRLTQWGIVLEDHKDGTTWRKKE